jgi:excisionase family DNA binding protein
MTDNEPMFTIAETCVALSVCAATLFKHMRAGKISAVKNGRQSLIPESEIARFKAAPAIKLGRPYKNAA